MAQPYKLKKFVFFQEALADSKNKSNTFARLLREHSEAGTVQLSWQLDFTPPDESDAKANAVRVLLSWSCFERLTQLFQMNLPSWDVAGTEGPALLKHLGSDDDQRVQNGARFLHLCSYYKKMGGDAAALARKTDEAEKLAASLAQLQAELKAEREKMAARKAARAARS